MRKRILGVLFILGIVLTLGAVMLAFDSYMTEDRKSSVRAEINSQLDEGAARYEGRREDGCRRRCGFFGTMASAITGLRDGVFAGLPFDPQEVFPAAPEGWTAGGYDLATLEQIIGRKMRRTGLSTSTDNRTLIDFDDTAAMTKAGAVRIYRNEDKLIAMAIAISRAGLRKEVPVRQPRASKPSALKVDGIPFQMHRQVSFQAMSDDFTPVAYRHLSMNLDGQVTINVVAAAEGDDITNLLAGFDLTPIVANLPRLPAGFSEGQSITSTAQLGQ